MSRSVDRLGLMRASSRRCARGRGAARSAALPGTSRGAARQALGPASACEPAVLNEKGEELQGPVRGVRPQSLSQ